MSSREAHLLEVLRAYFDLGNDKARTLLADLELRELRAGDWLFNQDDPGASLFLLARGRLQVWREGELGDASRLLGEVLPGESVGEVGLLTGEARSAGVRAIRDSLLLELDRAHFEHLAQSHPGIVLDIAAIVARRLHQNTIMRSNRQRAPEVIALRPLDDTDACDAAVRALVESLQPFGNTAVVSTEELAAHDDAQDVSEGLGQWISRLEAEHDRLVLVCAPDSSVWTEFAVRQADLELLITGSGEWAGLRDFERAAVEENDRSATRSTRRALILLHDPDAAIEDTRDWLEPRMLDFHLHWRKGNDEDAQRVARVLTGNAVGLVLGGGAARGFAHLGIYRAMVELGIPVDWIGGTSIGAIMGAAIALDVGPDEAEAMARVAFVDGKPFDDYTLPLISLLAGDRMVRLTKRHLGRDIEDLPIPLFCISTNISRAQVNIHEAGAIWRAVAASAALPGVLPPMVYEGELAVDGAILNNLPVDIMQAKPVGHIVAVELSVRESSLIDYDRLPSPWRVLLSRLLPFGRRLDAPGLATVVMKSTEVGTRQRVLELGARADLLMRPPVSEFSMLRVDQFEEIVEAGYANALGELSAWQQEALDA